MSKEKLKIAVYGSLRRGMGNHRVLGDDSVLLSTETIQAPFRMIDMGSYPGLIEAPENHEIVIEVYEVTPSTYKSVERLEGYPSFYDRKDVQTTEGQVGIYYLPGNGWSKGERFVAKTDGAYDWVKHRQARFAENKY